MLAYRDTTISNQVQIEPGILHARQFVQIALGCQPGAVTSSTIPIGKRALSVGQQILVLKQVSQVKDEAFHGVVNRFQASEAPIVLLNLGPTEACYYTRRIQAIVLKPGDLLFVAPQVDVFYGRCMLQAVFATGEEQRD